MKVRPREPVGRGAPSLRAPSRAGELKIPELCPHELVLEMATLVETLLADAGFVTQRLLTEGAPPVIYGELKGSGSHTLLLYNHYDVQPAEPLATMMTR